ncbi:MAG: PKD domain-containing protein [candidate division Zixibacteria bacterium]|nr:PKD domain-containing protein [candidate division Zixibacteria bacterium]MDH3938150.1 PKD domain-containing protein [candidate division Zixibacteria bacterium]MDH4033043.1 PKD domain-containing protein [candidate division Zixibacteria bacterium]
MRQLPTVCIIAVLMLLPTEGNTQTTRIDWPSSPANTPFWRPTSTEQLDQLPAWLQAQYKPKQPPPNHMSKTPGHYTRDDWAAAIDYTWGSGEPAEIKEFVWAEYWGITDSLYACWQDIDDDWDSIQVSALNELASGVSRGRFAAMLTYASMALMESHSRCFDYNLALTQPLPGVPIMTIGDWGSSTHFGASLTPLEDSTLLVYQTTPAHVLTLVPGDRVLGYDGVPWAELGRELLAAQLPTTWSMWGSSQEAFDHSVMMAAGLNWHLFDTIDIVKFVSGDTLHLATGVLDGVPRHIESREQLPVPGIPMPDTTAITWGIIEGTQIGYVYGLYWGDNAQTEFLAAIDTLLIDHETLGLIFDFRTNYGGNMFLAYPGLERLFADTVWTIGFDQRCDPFDHDLMCLAADPSGYRIDGDSSSFYDRPIAILTGPGAVSSGDQIALAMAFHPKARTFGKPTAAAFNGPLMGTFADGFWMGVAVADAWLVSNPGHYLTHDYIPVDETVWLTPEGVAQGRDDVVEAAATWIETDQAIFPNSDLNAGQAPCTVSFEGWTSHPIDQWSWEFGDGDSASGQNPVHVYTEGGIYDVTVSGVGTEGTYNYQRRSAVTVLADTMRTDSVELTDSATSVEIVVYAVNTVPLSRLDIPVEFDGDLSLMYDTFSTEGCRTEYFEVARLQNYSPVNSRLNIRLEASGAIVRPDLPVGDGPVLKLYLKPDGAPQPGQDATIEFDGYSDYLPRMYSRVATYLARSQPGMVFFAGCCNGIRGNVDSDPDDETDISDLVFLVSYMFDLGPAPECDEEANVDGDPNGLLDIADLVFLVDYMFNGGWPPGACPIH